MGCTSAKQVSAVPNAEEGQDKSHSNGDLLSDDCKMKGAEKVKYLGGDEGGVEGPDSTEKSLRTVTNLSIPVHCFQGRDYCSEEEEDMT
uniref:Uncharacterized protein n=1 Tax=Mola mola TaxID=94237 RepID=A0A3Q4BRJ5_MOLML